MFRIRRFGVMKTATVVAVMYMIIVAVFAIPFALLALIVTPSQASGGAGSIIVVALIAIFVYGVFGWVFTAIALAIYNLAARWVGGIEVEVETVAPPPPVPTWGARLPPSAPPPTIPPAPPSDPAPPASTV